MSDLDAAPVPVPRFFAMWLDRYLAETLPAFLRVRPGGTVPVRVAREIEALAHAVADTGQRAPGPARVETVTDVATAAARLGMSERTARRRLAAGQLAGHRVGARTWAITDERVLESMDDLGMPVDFPTDVTEAWADAANAQQLLDVADPSAAGLSDDDRQAYAILSGLAHERGKTARRRLEAAAPVEASDRVTGRLLEARPIGPNGERVFRARVIAYGPSANGRHYPESVLRAAVGMYNGSKVYDHHRDTAEMQSSTIAGMVGYLRNPEATAEGIEADLHLLPSATHAIEALDASLGAQQQALPPLVGISHDVIARFKPITVDGKRLQEAVEIMKVNSADIVADPAANGAVTRAVAGGLDPDPGPDSDTIAKTSYFGRRMIAEKIEAAKLPAAVAESVAELLPDRIVEATVDAAVSAIQKARADLERAGLTPTVPATQVVQESRDKQIKALDAFFDTRGPGGGYRSLREAYMDISGARPVFLGSDFNRELLAASFGQGYSSARSTESANTGTWAQILGDSITRRTIAEYQRPTLQNWRQIVSAFAYGVDFRTQRRGRLGGYGILPAVNQGQPYQPLTTPPDEEATYAATKRGGTEDLTLETLANDDQDLIRKIPMRLGRSAAITIYRFVWNLLADNGNTTYDSTALFHADHANTDTSAALSASTLSTGRRKMIKQASYGDSTDILEILPRFLAVPAELEEIAWQLCTSTVALPSGAPTGGASDIPNIHQGVIPALVPYWSDTNDWFLIADPMAVPTIEMGFYTNNDLPELFTQSDQSQGSVFDADKFTWKIRHIYSGTVLDHRAFYRGQG